MFWNWVGVLVVILVVFTLIQYINYRKRSLLEQENIKMQKDYLEKQRLYEVNVVENQKLRQIRHDLKKQLSVIEKMKNDESIAVEVLVHGKERYMNELGIDNNLSDVSVDELVAVQGALQISQVEMVNIVANLLDNAIEACERLTIFDGIKGFVRLEVNETSDKAEIIVINSKRSSENILEITDRTVKPDKENHGYGIKTIKEIVEKAGGIVEIEDLKEQFKIRVIKKH